jgi:hypothetical protein
MPTPKSNADTLDAPEKQPDDATAVVATPREVGGRAADKPEPVRYSDWRKGYGDWEKDGKCVDF